MWVHSRDIHHFPLTTPVEDDISHACLALQRGEREPPPAQQHMSESLTCVTSVCCKECSDWHTGKSSAMGGTTCTAYTVKDHHLVVRRGNCISVLEEKEATLPGFTLFDFIVRRVYLWSQRGYNPHLKQKDSWGKDYLCVGACNDHII